MASSITKKDLENLKWQDISIQTPVAGKETLILICENRGASMHLHDLLSRHPYGLRVSLQQNGNYSLSIEFTETEFGVTLPTDRNETNYPPIKKLHNGQIKFITTGVWTAGTSEKGRTCEMHKELLRFGELNIGEAFSNAREVHFIAGDEGKPSAVVLIFDDYDQLINAEAHEAFNELAQRSKMAPVLRISTIGGLANLRIWDIAMNLDIKVNGLKYSPEQLSDFLKVTGAGDSFAFVLGFPPPAGVKGAFAATSPKGVEVVTLKGYEYKPEK